MPTKSQPSSNTSWTEHPKNKSLPRKFITNTASGPQILGTDTLVQ